MFIFHTNACWNDAWHVSLLDSETCKIDTCSCIQSFLSFLNYHQLLYVSVSVNIVFVSVFRSLSSMNHVLERNACLDWHWVLQNYGEHVNFANTTLWSFAKSDEPPWFCRTHYWLKHTKFKNFIVPFFVLKLAIHLNQLCCENRRWWTSWEKVLMDGAFGTFYWTFLEG